MLVWVFGQLVCLTMCMPDASGGQKKVVASLALDLKAIVSCWEFNPVLRKSSQFS